MRFMQKLPLKIWQILKLLVFFSWELVVANLRVARDVLIPGPGFKRPGVVAVPLDVQSNNEITLLACLITLTPGTLSLDVTADRSVLYIHEMFIRDPEEVRQNIKQGFERRVMEVFR